MLKRRSWMPRCKCVIRPDDAHNLYKEIDETLRYLGLNGRFDIQMCEDGILVSLSIGATRKFTYSELRPRSTLVGNLVIWLMDGDTD